MTKKLYIYIPIFIFSFVFLFFVYRLLIPKEMKIQGSGSYSLSLVGDSGEGDQDKFKIVKGQNLRLKVKFSNISNHSSRFTLSAYVNYKMINFGLENKSFLMNSYEFDQDKDSNQIITLEIPSNYFEFFKNQLMLTVVSGADKYASDLDKVTKFYGIYSRGVVINSSIDINNMPDIKPIEINTSDYISNSNFSGISLNSNTVSKDFFSYPESQFNIARNKTFDLAIRVGGFENIENYLVILNIDHKQTLLDNMDYLYFHLPQSQVAFKKININPIRQTGKHDIYAFLVLNPWKDPDKKNMLDYMIHPSERFTVYTEE